MILKFSSQKPIAKTNINSNKILFINWNSELTTSENRQNKILNWGFPKYNLIDQQYLEVPASMQPEALQWDVTPVFSCHL